MPLWGKSYTVILTTLTIELDGSNFGTNDGTTDQIEMSRNVCHKDMTSYFRSRNLLIVSRVGHEFLRVYAEGYPVNTGPSRRHDPDRNRCLPQPCSSGHACSKRKCGQSYAGVSELPLSPRVREMIEVMIRKFG